MWHKREYSFLFKPKGILKDDSAFDEALRSFLLEHEYLMEPVICGESEYKMFTIEPLPQTIESKVVKIPTKK